MSEQERKPIKRALISVHNKAGIDSLARVLRQHGVEIVATGSTAAHLELMGPPVTRVEELTGFPECLDGRVKTLHPRVHAGLLADRDNPAHVKQLADLDIEGFDLLISNLYPFQQTVAAGADIDACVEQIDIGGPAMVRSAAKNHRSVAVFITPQDYAMIGPALEKGGFTLEERRALAARAFAEIADYDLAVAKWTASTLTGTPEVPQPGQTWPEFTGLAGWKTADLRYGENPHQAASLFIEPWGAEGLAQSHQHGGKEMSYNNYADADAAWAAANAYEGVACVAVVKHANPCGIAISPNSVAEAHRLAHECDPVSAFGGVIATNVQVSAEMAKQVAEIFTEVIVAPSYAPEALAILQERKNLRILEAPAYLPNPVELKQISGGFLAQTKDLMNADGDAVENWRLVAGSPATPEQLDDLEFAWGACRSVKSNAILLARGGASVGVGMGQVNRLDSARLAVARAGEERARGAVAASDAYFPFPDGLQILIDAGVTAVVQPGGSIRDDVVIAAAQEAGITMYMTGSRHFWH